GLDADPPFLVVDIGGGSTEFAVGTSEPEGTISTQMGSVRLTERHVSRDPPTSEELDAVRDAVRGVIDEVDAAIPVRDARTLVAVAGTATTFRAIDLELDRYDPDRIHRTRLSLA